MGREEVARCRITDLSSRIRIDLNHCADDEDENNHGEENHEEQKDLGKDRHRIRSPHTNNAADDNDVYNDNSE